MKAGFKRARTEAVVVGILWVGSLTVSAGVSYWLGQRPPRWALAGIPDWVVLGIYVPWLICFGLHTWFSLFFITDDDHEQNNGGGH